MLLAIVCFALYAQEGGKDDKNEAEESAQSDKEGAFYLNLTTFVGYFEQCVSRTTKESFDIGLGEAQNGTEFTVKVKDKEVDRFVYEHNLLITPQMLQNLLARFNGALKSSLNVDISYYANINNALKSPQAVLSVKGPKQKEQRINISYRGSICEK